MANQWLRLWHDMPNDPKWRTISRQSGMPISLVIAMYTHLMVDASRNVTRGHITVTHEDLASALDVTEGEISAVFDAMEGRVVENNYLLGWEKRQPKREDLGDSAMSRNVTLDKDKEESNTSLSSGKPEDQLQCPVERLVDLYHANMPNNPRMKILNDKRKAMIRQRWREAAHLHVGPFGYETQADGIAAWNEFFAICSDSDFLTGRVSPPPGRLPFIADIDFLLSPSGFAKVLENKYHREAA